MLAACAQSETYRIPLERRWEEDKHQLLADRLGYEERIQKLPWNRPLSKNGYPTML